MKITRREAVHKLRIASAAAARIGAIRSDLEREQYTVRSSGHDAQPFLDAIDAVRR